MLSESVIYEVFRDEKVLETPGNVPRGVFELRCGSRDGE
jgi:hypothetical protein